MKNRSILGKAEETEEDRAGLLEAGEIISNKMTQLFSGALA